VLTAEEARDQTTQNINLADGAQLNDIDYQIQNAISMGKCYIVTYDLTKTNRRALEELGYTVKVINQYNEFSYIISW
jgi:hypothetical protein